MRRDRKDEEWQPEMPPLEVGHWLVGYLFEIGPTMPAGMGSGLISHQEIAAWQALSGVRLKPWEARALRLLSAEYLRESREAEKRERPAPWNPGEVAPEDLSAVADAMRESMRRRAAL
jgi:hypothetical protein